MKPDYFQWIRRVRYILAWLYEIMAHQVKSCHELWYPHPTLWPGWDWARVNALYSHRSAPWHFSYLINIVNEAWDEAEDYEDYL